MIHPGGWYERTSAGNLRPIMNPPLAFSPLIVHIPHAVPVVIVWGILIRFYFVQRKLKAGSQSGSLAGVEADAQSDRSRTTGAADRPVTRRVWAVEDTPEQGVSGDRQEVPVAGRTPAGRL
jgi:hypothetical protein